MQICCHAPASRTRKWSVLRGVAATVVALSGTFLVANVTQAATTPQDACAPSVASLASFADITVRIVSATYNPDGQTVQMSPAPGVNIPIVLPAHCEIFGVMRERKGENGQSYAIRFHMRLPVKWNGRFLFQGGGGSNGDIGNALGMVTNNGPVAAALGYAVVSQDSGHDNATNSDPAFNGQLAFGFDPQARLDYGHTSLKAVADAAKSLVKAYYGKPARYSYFVGCSKGGQEGMTFAQFYPDEFDGIIAGAPGFALPRAAVAEAWDVQAFGALVAADGRFNPMALHTAYSSSDLDLVRAAILEACDNDDGLKDGIVADMLRCTDEKVLPKLKARVCAGDKSDGCLSGAQLEALIKSHDGPKSSTGQALYAGWFWPSGISGEDWRIWKIGSSDGHVPALNVVLGAGSLASVFTTPPTPLGADPQSLADYAFRFNFDRDASSIYAVAAPFTTSAWQDVGSHSTDLSAFKKRGGKLIVPHGDSDPVFSLKDTLAWYDEVNMRNSGRAATFVRVFPVPGMCHCAGGQSTDTYDAFDALVNWVEHSQAPEAILATAGPRSPWPGRERPLCVYPEVARYQGGNPEKASSFACKA